MSSNLSFEWGFEAICWWIHYGLVHFRSKNWLKYTSCIIPSDREKELLTNRHLPWNLPLRCLDLGSHFRRLWGSLTTIWDQVKYISKAGLSEIWKKYVSFGHSGWFCDFYWCSIDSLRVTGNLLLTLGNCNRKWLWNCSTAAVGGAL